jgi:hypothetical protein
MKGDEGRRGVKRGNEVELTQFFPPLHPYSPFYPFFTLQDDGSF